MYRRLLGAVAAAAVIAVLVVAPGGAATASAVPAGAVPAAVVPVAAVRAAITATGPASVVGVGSNRCLDVQGAATANYTPVIVWDCNGQANQAWTYTARGELRIYGNTKCLDIKGGSTQPGGVVQLFGCNDRTWQQWTLQSDGTIRSVKSGLCLDVVDGGTANGSRLQIWTCNGGAGQKWRTTLTAPDTQPPAAPANPRVSNLACRSATLSWDAATDNVGVSGYDIYHDGQFMTSVAGSTTSASVALTPGANWGLYVNARDAVGNVSQASATVRVAVPQCTADTQAPSTPTGVTARANGTTVTVGWTASTDNVGVRFYDVFRGGTKAGTVTGSDTAAPATTFTDSGLASNTDYSYTVVARDAQNNASAASAAASVRTGAACASDFCGVTQVATDTDLPWGLDTLPDQTVLYSRRDTAELVRLDPATGSKTVVGVVPNVQGTDGEGGLLGVELSPTFSSDNWVYLMHSTATDNRVVRIKLVNNRLDTSSVQVLVSGILRNKYHNGGRLRFGPDGKLYMSTGDAQDTRTAQDLRSLSGKILRINPDGSIPSDNPFGSAVWSYGHRNPQGLAFDSSGRLWEQEFGNGIMDETNLIVRGGNYGWPACEGTSGTCGTAGFIAPKKTYPTSEGSCSGIAIVRDVLYVACQRGARLYRMPITGDSLGTATQAFVGTYGRLRTVEPDGRGGLWLTTTNSTRDEKILRVVLGG